MKQALFTILFSLSASAAMAQGMVTDIKIVAVQEWDSLAPQASGYSGANSEDLDFRKGRGGGYVFALSKTSKTPELYITGVRVEKRTSYGLEFNVGEDEYKPAPFFQAASRKDGEYRGGLNGRNYLIYGGAYPEQDHVYFTRSGNKDFSRRVLESIEVRTSKPTTGANQTQSGGHAGGSRYFLYTWHTHNSQFRPIDGSILKHEHYCGIKGCGLTVEEPHRFIQLYGNDAWMQYTKADTHVDCDSVHYKKCIDCGLEVTEHHKFATYVSDWKNHNQRCLTCDYVIQAEHKQFGQQKLPVDEHYHMIYCGDCGFLKKLPHSLGRRSVVREDCEHAVVKYTCVQCFHEICFDEPGAGHSFDDNGFCTNMRCLHPYQRPAVEYSQNGKDSTYVIRSFGNLYWASDYVNNRRPKAKFRLDTDLIATDYVTLPWIPIGTNDSTAFEGTFDGNGHVITMLQTEEPVAGCGYRGLFGAIGKGGVVKNVALAACNMRGWDNIGAVAGVNNGTIESCYVVSSSMSTIGTGMNLGGICGLNRGTICGCVTERDVWVGGARDYAGGICGTNENGTLLGNITEAICGSGTDATLPETASEN